MPTHVSRLSSPAPVAADMLEAWVEIPTAIASDVSRGRLLVDPKLRPLRPFAGAKRLFGPAVTAWCEPGDIGAALYAVAIAQAGDVIVIDGGDYRLSALVGEHLCGAARRKGVAGMVVNGAVRDVATLAGWPDFPVFAAGVTARGPISLEHGSVNTPIVCGGVPVAPHDLILGDDDGVIVIPRGEAGHWLARAREKVALEQEWDRRLSGGESLARVFGLPEG
jgi:4-hydroxy-4-methyl-2-oxoglutarate aldolase